jgi:hypothetical protein
VRRSPYALIAASVLTAGVFALVVNLASSTVMVAPSWLPAVWIAAGLVLAALTAVEILRHRSSAPAVTDLESAMKSLSYRMADGLRRQDEGRETSARVALQVRWRPMAAIHVGAVGGLPQQGFGAGGISGPFPHRRHIAAETKWLGSGTVVAGTYNVNPCTKQCSTSTGRDNRAAWSMSAHADARASVGVSRAARIAG